MTEETASLALQGPTSREILKACTEGDIAALKYFRVMPAKIAGIPVEISRTGYTGDLGLRDLGPGVRGGEALGRAHGGGPALRHHPLRASTPSTWRASRRGS